MLYTVGIAGGRAVGSEDTVTGDDNGNGVVADGLSDGLCRATADMPRDVAVGCCGSVWYLQQFVPNAELERSALGTEGRQELWAPAREVDVKPAESFF